MSIKLNHTIVFSRNKDIAAAFLTDILGLSVAVPVGPFLTIELENEITLGFEHGLRFAPPPAPSLNSSQINDLEKCEIVCA